MSRTISIEAKCIIAIENTIMNGKAKNISDFMQKSVSEYLKKLNYE